MPLLGITFKGLDSIGSIEELALNAEESVSTKLVLKLIKMISYITGK
jgi:hypothetical protein